MYELKMKGPNTWKKILRGKEMKIGNHIKPKPKTDQKRGCHEKKISTGL